MTLKKLKEIGVYIQSVKRKELIAEAIKRIKTCKEIITTDLGLPVLCGESLLDERCSACKRDMWFYDLTEEDLR